MRLMEMAHEKWGKLEWKALFQPAIKLAEEGFIVTPALNNWLVEFEPMWKDFPDARAIYYVDGKPAPVGARLDRKSVVEGKSVSVRVDLGGRCSIKKKNKKKKTTKRRK